jgi:murein DD-endopeptidase MepM/ murein hydrolase activator NlpD
MGKLILICTIFPVLSFASINYSPNSNMGVENLASVEKQLSKLTVDIDILERTLQEKNRKLLKNIEDKKKIEEKLTQVKEILEKNQSELNLQITQVKRYFQNVLLGEVGGPDMPSTLMGKKLLTKILEDKVRELKAIKFQMGKIHEGFIDLQKRYELIVQTENDLNQLLGNLELRKKKLAENYFETQEKKEKLSIKLNRIKTQLQLKKSIAKVNLSDESFSSPLEDYFDVTFKDKGLTFKFKGLNQIFASKKGRVVYTGSLSTYGNVLMIDHGNNTRSVILGDLEITVKKGEEVKKGAIIGHTKGDSSKEGNLYFEIRNKNIVQNTITLMETDFYQNHKDKIL